MKSEIDRRNRAFDADYDEEEPPAKPEPAKPSEPDNNDLPFEWSLD